MLPDLTFLLAVLLGLGMFGPGDYEPLLAFGGTAALTAIAVALTSLSAERTIRALHEEGGLTSAQARLTFVPLTPLLAWLVSLETLRFGSAIYDLLPSTTWLLRHVLLFVPALIGFGAAWTARAKIEAAVAQRLGRPVAHATAAQAIRAGLRRNGLALIPLGVVLGLLEGLSLAADLGVPGCATARAALEDVPPLRVAFELALLALLALVLPALLSRLIASEPFPAGPQRERLEQLARALRLRYREMRLWKTGGRGLNAMVVGLTPGTRRIFVTDGLLQALPPHEVEAVFCHEAGHAQRHHLLWFLGVAGLLSLAFLVLDEPLTRLGLSEGLMRSLLHLGLLWFVVLGSLSRHFERESDVDGGAHAALLDPAAPALDVPGLAAPLPAGAARMVGALKRLEALLGNVYSHRHGTPSERAAFVAFHATQDTVRAAFTRRSRGVRLGLLAVGLLLVAVVARRCARRVTRTSAPSKPALSSRPKRSRPGGPPTRTTCAPRRASRRARGSTPAGSCRWPGWAWATQPCAAWATWPPPARAWSAPSPALRQPTSLDRGGA